MARAPLQIARPLNIGAPAGSPPLIGGGLISAALMNPQMMTPQGPGMAPPQFSRQFPGPGSDPLANAPQLPAAASAMPMSAPNQGGGMGSRVGNFLGSDAALGLAAGILEGGTTGQALGRGFGYALAAKQAANKGQATTDDIREYAFAKQQGFTGTFTDYMQSMKRAGATTINTGDTADAAFAKEFGKANADQFFERRQGALDAVQSLQAASEAERLLDSGVITGFGANWMVGMGKALQQAGFSVADDPIANTEAFVATRAQEVGRIIKLFGAGTGLSDADREFATKAAAGNITMNESSIRRILEINRRASMNVIESYNQDASQIDPSLSPFDLTVRVPETATVPSPANSGGGWQDMGNGVRVRELP